MITISSNNSFRRILAVVLAVGAFAALPALASAQTIDPTSDQYHNVLQQVSRGGSPPPTPPPSCSNSDSSTTNDCTPPKGGLPFTGLDVAALGGVAAFLLLAGLGLRRARFGERNPA